MDIAEHPQAVLEMTRLECAPEYVHGFPYHVAILVRYRLQGRDTPGFSFSQQLEEAPELEFLSSSPCVGVELVDGLGRTAVRIPAERYDDEHIWISRYPLLPNQPRRMLIDLSDYIPPHIGPDVYRLAVDYVASGRRTSLSGVFRLRDATGEERERFPGPEPLRRWSEWALAEPPETERPVSASDPARLNRLVRKLVHADPIGRFAAEQFDALDGLYRPEAALLRLEWLAATGVDVSASSQLALRDYPELEWWIDRVREGNGVIADWRKALGK